MFTKIVRITSQVEESSNEPNEKLSIWEYEAAHNNAH